MPLGVNLVETNIPISNFFQINKHWLREEGNPYSNIAVDTKGTIAIDWGTYGIPETFIVNSKGIIKYRHVGPITKKIYKKINLLIKNIK